MPCGPLICHAPMATMLVRSGFSLGLTCRLLSACYLELFCFTSWFFSLHAYLLPLPFFGETTTAPPKPAARTN